MVWASDFGSNSQVQMPLEVVNLTVCGASLLRVFYYLSSIYSLNMTYNIERDMIKHQIQF